MREKIGFTMALIGLGGLSEAYGSAYQITISLLLVIVGGTLIHRGLTDEKQNIEHCHSDSNVLDRLYFLRR